MADPACPTEQNGTLDTTGNGIQCASLPPPALLKKAHYAVVFAWNIWYLPLYEVDRQHGGAVEQCKTSGRAIQGSAHLGIQSTPSGVCSVEGIGGTVRRRMYTKEEWGTQLGSHGFVDRVPSLNVQLVG
jgi:hypothetical protein